MDAATGPFHERREETTYSLQSQGPSGLMAPGTGTPGIRIRYVGARWDCYARYSFLAPFMANPGVPLLAFVPAFGVWALPKKKKNDERGVVAFDELFSTPRPPLEPIKFLAPSPSQTWWKQTTCFSSRIAPSGLNLMKNVLKRPPQGVPD